MDIPISPLSAPDFRNSAAENIAGQYMTDPLARKHLGRVGSGRGISTTVGISPGDPGYDWLSRPVLVTIFKNVGAKSKAEQTLSFRALEQLVSSTGAAEKSALPLLKLARFGDLKTEKGSLRHDDNIECVTGIEADYDGERVSISEIATALSKAGVAALLYGSPRHSKAKPRFRILCLTSVSLPPEERDRLVDRLNGAVGGILAGESWTRSQAFYFGVVGGNPDHETRLIEGQPIDLLPELDATAASRSDNSPKPATPGAGGAAATTSANALAGGGPAAVFATHANLPDMVGAAQAGMHGGWYDRLSEDQKRAVVDAALVLLEAYADKDRGLWRNLVWSIAASGLPDSREIAVRWSEGSEKFEPEGFDNVWNSFEAKKITVGTLFHHAFEAAKAENPDFQPGEWLASVLPATAPTVGNFGWDPVPAIMDQPTAGRLLNERIGFARSFNGPPSLYQRQRDGSVAPITNAELQLLLAPYKIRVPDGSGTGVKLVPAASWWLGWIGRHTVDRVIYDPEGTLQAPGEKIENTWRGFAVAPKPGSWKKIAYHLLHVICSGNREHFRFLLRWLAFAVQRPGTSPGSMVILRSEKEGVGKSTLSQIMLAIFGLHGYEATAMSSVTGDFTDALVNISFLALEEAQYPGDHKHKTQFKNLATSKEISINPKGKKRYSVPNTLHILLTTNEKWAVPAGNDARRFFVLDVTRKEPASYFAELYSEINGGGVAALLRALLALDLTDFKPNLVPVTDALRRQQWLSADAVPRWVSDAVLAGELVAGYPGGGFGQTVTGAALFAAYEVWCRSHARRLESRISFGRAMKSLGIVRGGSNSRPSYAIPPAATLLANAATLAGIR